MINKKIFFASILFLSAGIVFCMLKHKNSTNDWQFVLPELPYSYDALEPYIDTETMKIHYTKHHQAYVDNLNKALQDYPELHKKTLQELLTNLDSIPEKIKDAVRNNAGGHYNHSLFWTFMTPKSSKLPNGEIKVMIDKYFGDFDKFKDKFSKIAKTKFGSGWAWLCLDNKGNLILTSTSNQDSPISQNLIPLLGLDVWEHAYYLKYQNRRPDYISAWWNVVNWDEVEKRYRDAKK